MQKTLSCFKFHNKNPYILHFSEAISNELERTGITVTIFCLGATATGFQDSADMNERKLVKGKKLPTAKETADYGYKKMMIGSHQSFLVL